jgi:hypothetical protein
MAVWRPALHGDLEAGDLEAGEGGLVIEEPRKKKTARTVELFVPGGQ